jgi:hypothetical protein
MADPASSATRLIAKVIRDLGALDTFESYADLKDAVRRRLARLRIRYQPADLDDAIALVDSNTQLVRPQPLDARAHVGDGDGAARELERPPDHAEACAILTRLGIGAVPVLSVPAVRELSPREIRSRQYQRDRAKALRMVTDELLDAEQRCAALEAKKP